MKVCILSMQRVLNYGSLLQAYSLKKILESMGHTVSFIDIEPDAADHEKRTRVVTFKEGTGEVRKDVIHRLLKQDKVIYYALRKIKAKRKVVRLQRLFEREQLGLSDDHNEKEYDVCVIGSDEVFNCMNDEEWGFTSQLFGNVRQAEKVITYAASCGFTKAEDVSDDMREVIAGAFERIGAFSVRDENTAGFVRHFSGREPLYNMDPVVVGNFDKEIEQCADCARKLPKRYCIVYAYHGRIANEDEIHAILKICRERKLTPVSIGGFQRWIHNHLELSPFEVLYAFMNANYVVTDTFHGAILAAKYAKRYAILVRDSNRNKLEDLLGRLGIEAHRAMNPEMICELYDVMDDKATIHRIEHEEYRRTVEYLEQNI